MGGGGCTGSLRWGGYCCGGRTGAGIGEGVVGAFGGVSHVGDSCGGSLGDLACTGTV